MKQKQIIASLGALAVTGLAIYLIRKRKRSNSPEGFNYDANSLHRKSRTNAFSRAKVSVYEPDDHPE
jgi:LPXTG-motif cell wall-anchored protein